MKRKLSMAVVVVIAALTLSASAWAATTVQKIPFSVAVVICNGDTVNISGTLLDTVTTTTTPSEADRRVPRQSAGHQRGRCNYRNGVSRDRSDTRDRCVHTARRVHNHVRESLPPPGDTGRSELHRQRETEHVTVTPNGTVTVSFDNFSSTC